MIIILDEKFNVTSVSNAYVNQCSAALGEIQVVTPYPNNVAMTASFILPDGTVTPRYAMTSTVSATDRTHTVFTLNMPSTVFSMQAGSVLVQFFVMLPGTSVTDGSCLLNVRSATTSVDGMYPIDDTFICVHELVDTAPTIATDINGLYVDDRENGYYLAGALLTPDTQAQVQVDLKYPQSQVIATASTNFVIRKGVPFDMTDYDVSADVWAQVQTQLSDLTTQVSSISQDKIATLSGDVQLWTKNGGFYMVEDTAKLYYAPGQFFNVSFYESAGDKYILFIQRQGNVVQCQAFVTDVDYYSPTKGKTCLLLLYSKQDGETITGEAKWFRFKDYATTSEVQSLIQSAVTTALNTPV